LLLTLAYFFQLAIRILELAVVSDLTVSVGLPAKLDIVLSTELVVIVESNTRCVVAFNQGDSILLLFSRSFPFPYHDSLTRYQVHQRLESGSRFIILLIQGRPPALQALTAL